MSARPSDPVAVLREAAKLLPEWSAGHDALNKLAMCLEIGAAGVGHVRETLALANAGVSPWTPDERAAFALAREALSTLDADADKETR